MIQISFQYYGNGWYRLSDRTFAKKCGDEIYLCPCFLDDENNKRRAKELNDILDLEKNYVRSGTS